MITISSANAHLISFDAAHMPRMPFVSDDLQKNGLWREYYRKACTFKYIQPNSDAFIRHIVVDVDSSIHTALYITGWQALGLPEPSWLAMGPTGRAHVGYVLATPVCKTENAKPGPIRYADSIYKALIAAFRAAGMNADCGYGRLICKNPLYPGWHSMGSGKQYELGELAGFVKQHLNSVQLPPQGAKATATAGKPGAQSAPGRNCALFDTLRVHAYSRASLDSAALAAELEQLAATANTRGLPAREVRATIKSIVKFVHEKMHKTSAEFSQRQAESGRRGGLASGASRYNATAEKRTQALALSAQGNSIRAIAQALETPKSTVQRWLHEEKARTANPCKTAREREDLDFSGVSHEAYQIYPVPEAVKGGLTGFDGLLNKGVERTDNATAPRLPAQPVEAGGFGGHGVERKRSARVQQKKTDATAFNENFGPFLSSPRLQKNEVLQGVSFDEDAF